MANYYNYAQQTEYICVDEDPEGRPGTSGNADGAFLYPVEARCGSLPCLPYFSGHELACVVCTI